MHLGLHMRLLLCESKCPDSPVPSLLTYTMFVLYLRQKTNIVYVSSEGSGESGHLGSPEPWLLDSVIIRDYPQS